MKTIEDMKLELLSDNSNKFMQTLIDYLRFASEYHR